MYSVDDHLVINCLIIQFDYETTSTRSLLISLTVITHPRRHGQISVCLNAPAKRLGKTTIAWLWIGYLLITPGVVEFYYARTKAEKRQNDSNIP